MWLVTAWVVLGRSWLQQVSWSKREVVVVLWSHNVYQIGYNGGVSAMHWVLISLTVLHSAEVFQAVGASGVAGQGGERYHLCHYTGVFLGVSRH